MPLAAEEEDRSDMEGAHHHGGTILDAASRVGKRRPEQLRTGDSCTDRENRHCERSEAIHSFVLVARWIASLRSQ